MKLFYYELVKLKKYSFLFVLFTILIVINGIFIFHQTNTINTASASISDIESVFNTYYYTPEKIHTGYSAYLNTKIQNDKIAEETIKSNKQPQYIPYEKTFSDNPNFPDSYFYDLLFSEIDKISTYPDTISFIINNATKTISEYKNMGISDESYAIQYQRKAIEKYTHTAETIHLGLEYVHGWDILFSHQIDNVFIFILVITISVFSFLYENETGMNYILRVSYFGRNYTAIAKILSILICIVFIVCIFTLENCLIIGIIRGFSNPNNAIQIIDEFRLCPTSLTIIEYFGISIFIEISTYFLFSLLVILFGLLTKNILYTYISGVSLYAINLLPEFIAQNNPDLFFKKINLLTASSVTPLFDNFKTVNLFGSAIECSSFTIFSFIVFIPVLGAMIIFIYAKNLHRNTPDIKRNFSSLRKPIINSQCFDFPALQYKSVHHSTIFSWEIQKILRKPSVIIIILGCLLLKLLISNNSYSPKASYSEDIYREYMTVLAGELTDDKMLYISTERDNINNILLQYSDYQENYANGLISYDEYESFLTLYSEAYEKNVPLSRVEQHLYYSIEQSSLNKESWFVYDTGWNKLFTANFDWVLYFLQLILFSNVFMIEHTSKTSSGAFYSILRTTKSGRHISFNRKLCSTVILSVAFFTLFSLIDIYHISSNFYLPLAEAPLYSLSFMSESILDVSIGIYWILYVLAKLFANIIYSLLIISVSSLVRSFTPSLTIIIFITLVPHLFAQTGFKYFNFIDYTSLLRFTPIILGNIPGCIYALMCILYTSVVAISAKKRWIY